MDARTVAELARIGVGTLNVWVQRGLIPGMTIGARGRQREFDEKIAIDVLMIAELVRLGWDAPVASVIVSQRSTHNYLLIANPSGAQAFTPMSVMSVAPPEIRGFESKTDLPNVLAEFPGGEPSVYLTINVHLLIADLTQRLQWHAEWVKAGRPNALTVRFPPPDSPLFVLPEGAEKSAPAPAPSKPPAPRQRREKKQ